MSATNVEFHIPAGWDAVTARVQLGGDIESLSWITNGSIDPDDRLSGWPTKTTPRLSSGQSLVWAGAMATASDANVYTKMDLPLQLKDAKFLSDSYENQPAPHISLFGPLRAIVDGSYVIVMAWLGSNDPPMSLVASTQSVLDGLSLSLS